MRCTSSLDPVAKRISEDTADPDAAFDCEVFQWAVSVRGCELWIASAYNHFAACTNPPRLRRRTLSRITILGKQVLRQHRSMSAKKTTSRSAMKTENRKYKRQKQKMCRCLSQNGYANFRAREGGKQKMCWCCM